MVTPVDGMESHTHEVDRIISSEYDNIDILEQMEDDQLLELFTQYIECIGGWHNCIIQYWLYYSESALASLKIVLVYSYIQVLWYSNISLVEHSQNHALCIHAWLLKHVLCMCQSVSPIQPCSVVCCCLALYIDASSPACLNYMLAVEKLSCVHRQAMTNLKPVRYTCTGE